MKSRTSFFDKTIFKKDITRFAPAWVLYTLCLLLGMVLMRDDVSAYGFHSNLAALIRIMSVINFGYALLASQLLFGDLYNSRMCHAVHALPVTREGLFVSHCAAGLSWSLAPTALAALLALVLGIGSDVEGGWQISLWWLLGTNLQYLFFFGLAAFSALCVGNRFAQALVYGIINFASILAYWLVDSLYVPMLYGIRTDAEPFTRLSPVVWFSSCEYIDVNREWNYDRQQLIRCWYEMADGWGYLAICAALGGALLVCACLLYRRRQLECAGDFMAVKALEPAFLVVYPLIVAAVFHFFVDEMLSVSGLNFIYLFIGLAVGFFTGRMLLDRTIRIFRKRTFAQFAALAVGFCLTLAVTWVDPLGIVEWIPDAGDVVSVNVSPNHSYSNYNTVTLDQPEAIADVLKLHRHALEHREYAEMGHGYYVTEDGEAYVVNNQAITLHYLLTDGSVKSRYYVVNLDTEAGGLIIPYFNTLDAIFADFDGNRTLEGILQATQTVSVSADSYVGDLPLDQHQNVLLSDPVAIRELMEAIVSDAQQGLMAQNWNFRPDPDVSTSYWLEFDMGNQIVSINVYTDCIHTNTWLEKQGFISNTLLELGGVTGHYQTK